MASVSKRRWTHNGTDKEAWIVRYKDASGAHRQRTFERKKEADGFRTKIDHERATEGGVVHLRPLTVEQLWVDYARHVDRRYDDDQLKRGSHRNIVDAFRISIIPRLGRVRLADLSIDSIEKFFLDLRQVDNISARTALHRISKLSGFLDYAKRRGLVRVNVASEARKHIGSVPIVGIRTFEVDQVQRLLAVAKTRRPNQHARTQLLVETMVNISAFCGLRIGEVLALTNDDVDLSNKTLRVTKTLDQWDTITKPKTKAANRIVPLPDVVCHLLSKWMQAYYRENDRALIFRRTTEARGIKDAPIQSRHFGMIYFWRLCDAAGLGKDREGRRFHFHALRHFAGSWWIQKGVPITTVSRLLGHANPSVTMQVYAHSLMSPEAAHSVLDGIANELSAQPLRNDLKVL